MITVDAVVGLCRGDEGKGKVCHHLLSQGDYTHVLRYAGGGNAGHTIYHEGKKFVTHQVPAGVFYGIRSVIGPGCVINPEKLVQEIEYLETNGIEASKFLKIAANAHLITPEHLLLDGQDTTIGTTRTGNGPCYSDKYSRKGIQAKDYPLFKDKIIHMQEEFYGADQENVILAEGAQGFYLDVDWGKYPFVTSSHCGIGSVLLNGFNHKQIRRVYGVAKVYETYVGADKFEPDFLNSDSVFQKIRELGQEYGATTGRPRQCNWLNLDELIMAAQMNGVDEILFNKLDILDQVGTWMVRWNDGEKYSFDSSFEFQEFVRSEIQACHQCDVRFSSNPHDLT